MDISQFFLNGDLKGAIAYMREHGEFKDVLPAYVAIFENGAYRAYEIPDELNEILRLYQIYFRDTFYCGVSEKEAADKLLTNLKVLLHMPNADEELLTEKLRSTFEERGVSRAFWENAGILRPVYLAGDPAHRLLRRVAERKGGVYGEYPQRVRISELDGLSDLRQVRHARLGFARRHDQLYRAGVRFRKRTLSRLSFEARGTARRGHETVCGDYRRGAGIPCKARGTPLCEGFGIVAKIPVGGG